EDATAVSDLQSDDAETQPSDQLPVDDATATEDPQETPDNTTTTDEEPSLVERVVEFFKDIFEPAEEKTAEEQKTTVGTFSLEQKITIDGKSVSTYPILKPITESYSLICVGKAPTEVTLTNDDNYQSNSFSAGTQCTIYPPGVAPKITGYTGAHTVTADGHRTGNSEINFTIEAGKETKITIRFDYTRHGQPQMDPEGESSFLVHKHAQVKLENGKNVDNPILKGKKFKFTWKCTPPNGGKEIKGSITLMDTKNQKIEYIPEGSSCTVTEDLNSAKIPGYTHKVLVSLNSAAPEESPTGTTTFTTSNDKLSTVLLTNTYSQDKKPTPTSSSIAPQPEAKTAEFTLAKIVKNDDAKAKLKGQQFTFKWECTTNGDQEKSIKEGEEKLIDGQSKKITGLPLNSSCTIKETDIPQLDGYTHSLEWLTNEESKGSENPFTVTPREKGSENPLTLTAVNTYTKDELPKPEIKTGKFRVKKLASGLKEDGSRDYDKKFTEHEFKFTWECTPPEGQGEKQTGEAKVKSAGEFRSDEIPLGSSCTVTEDEAFSKIDGYTHKLVVNNEKVTQEGNKFSFTIDSQVMFTIDVSNDYTPEGKPKPNTGGFTLKKQVEGLTDKNKEFEFTWICNGDLGTQAVRGKAKLKDGATFKVENLPIDSTCRLSETNAPIAGYSHSLSWSTSDGKKSTDPIIMVDPRGANKPELVVTAVNKYTPVVPPVTPTTETTTKPVPSTTSKPVPTTTATSSSKTTTPTPTTSSSAAPKPGTGSFTLEKKVEGTQSQKEFDFDWRCTDDDSKLTGGTTKLKNGERFVVTDLPLNSTCRVFERDPSIAGFKHSLKWLTNGEEKASQNGVVLIDPRKAGEKELVVTAVNTYTKDDKPAPTTTSSSTTRPVPTTSATSSMTPTTSASSTSSATSTSSTTSSVQPTTTTSSTEPIVPTTTGKFPPIIPIPIPIPVPPAPFPPAPAPAPAPAPNGGNNSPAPGVTTAPH
ncbi:DUF5979 domain-containing protein, partial [Corynebacterium kutscheri]|uniref:DUF5979 domain-containing protein n=1 Tax=Corynebacterium kutscheri TaxID=35755 RepID=UPI0037C18588